MAMQKVRPRPLQRRRRPRLSGPRSLRTGSPQPRRVRKRRRGKKRRRRRQPRRPRRRRLGKAMSEQVMTSEQLAATDRRNEKVGHVVSTKMQKTIVVEVEMRKAHPKYKRTVRLTKKFYAHDERNTARVGDMVRIRETRPMSKLKRWQLQEILRRSALAQVQAAEAAAAPEL